MKTPKRRRLSLRRVLGTRPRAASSSAAPGSLRAVREARQADVRAVFSALGGVPEALDLKDQPVTAPGSLVTRVNAHTEFINAPHADEPGPAVPPAAG